MWPGATQVRVSARWSADVAQCGSNYRLDDVAPFILYLVNEPIQIFCFNFYLNKINMNV